MPADSQVYNWALNSCMLREKTGYCITLLRFVSKLCECLNQLWPIQEKTFWIWICLLADVLTNKSTEMSFTRISWTCVQNNFLKIIKNRTEKIENIVKFYLSARAKDLSMYRPICSNLIFITKMYFFSVYCSTKIHFLKYMLFIARCQKCLKLLAQTGQRRFATLQIFGVL